MNQIVTGSNPHTVSQRYSMKAKSILAHPSRIRQTVYFLILLVSILFHQSVPSVPAQPQPLTRSILVTTLNGDTFVMEVPG